jgi:signal transduction histidine kinase
VVENVDEDHVRKASWLFPLYLLAINLFVLPIAVGGLLEFGDATHADAFVLKLPLATGNEALAVLAFIGGLSAATGMVIVATTALSTMICNDLVVPVLLRWRALRLAERRRLTGLILGVRRGAIVGVLLLGYAYLRTVGDGYSLVSIGLISFAAVAQFAPAVIGGLYWRRATRKGALAGLVAGFVVWGYTLPLPSLVDAGYLPVSFVTDGPFGIEALRPYALFGMEGFAEVPHTMFWSLLVNATLYAGVSLFTVPSVIERSQAALFVDVFRHAGTYDPTRRATAPVRDLRTLLQRFLGWRRTERALQEYARRHDLDPNAVTVADEDLVRYAESLLSGVIGAASARVVVGSVVQETPLRLGEVMDILDETQQVLAYSRELERKRSELERTTRELQSANEKLQQLDRLKDDFVSTVTHELRTPLTAIRALTEILHANPDLDDASRQEFLQTIQRETRRLTRLVNQVLDVQRLDAEPADLDGRVDLGTVVRDALAAMEAPMTRDGIDVECIRPDAPAVVRGDRDRLLQVVLNLLSNAAKYSDAHDGRVQVHLRDTGEHLQVAVADNGPGIPAGQQEVIFQKFRQAQTGTGPQGGSGLGLAIAQQIVHQHGGDLWVESDEGDGATFAFRLPKAAAESGGEAPEPSSHSSSDVAPWGIGEGYEG